MSSLHIPGVTTSQWSGTTTYAEHVTEVDTLDHAGRRIVIVTQEAVQVFAANEHREESRNERTLSEVTVDGRRFGARPAGTTKAAVKKITAKLDEIAEDVALLPRVQAVISNEIPPLPVEAVEIGDVVSIHSMGQWRQGIVVKIAKTRATVAYTSASNSSRIYRKADAVTSLRRF